MACQALEANQESRTTHSYELVREPWITKTPTGRYTRVVTLMCTHCKRVEQITSTWITN